jgi:integrase/recombinase XerD
VTSAFSGHSADSRYACRCQSRYRLCQLVPLPDLHRLLESWELHRRAERKSPETVGSYGDGVRWCARTGTEPALTRPAVNGFVADLLDSGALAATARARQLAVRRFSAWLVAEEEIEHDELLGLTPPKLDQKVTERLTDEQIRALVKACSGREFRDRRDEAIVRFMLETAARRRGGRDVHGRP